MISKITKGEDSPHDIRLSGVSFLEALDKINEIVDEVNKLSGLFFTNLPSSIEGVDEEQERVSESGLCDCTICTDGREFEEIKARSRDRSLKAISAEGYHQIRKDIKFILKRLDIEES